MKLLLITIISINTSVSFGQNSTNTNNNQSEPDTIKIELDSLLKYGKYSYVLDKEDLEAILDCKNLKFIFTFNNETLDSSCITIKRRNGVLKIKPDKICEILLKKKEKKFRIIYDGVKIGILTIRKTICKSGDDIIPDKSSLHSKSPFNNTTIVLNNCDKTISIRSTDKKPRKKLFIKQSELLNFEIENINPLRDAYKINNEPVNLNQTLPETISTDTPIPSEDTRKTNGDTIMETIIKLDEEISLYLNKVSLTSCPDYYNINQKIECFFNKIPNYNPYFSTNDIHITRLNEEMQKRIDSIHQNLKMLSKFQDNKITTLPVSVTGKNIDLIRYNIEYGTLDKDKKPVFTDNVSYDIYIRHGIKIDYSAGIFVSLYTNDRYRLKDTLMILDTLNNTSSIYKQILMDNKDFGNMSVGTTVNLIYRCGSTFNPGLSFGMMLPINKENLSPHFMAGLSGIFGKEQRIGLSVGFVYGQTNKLTSGYKENGIYDLKDTGVPYTPSYSWGYYFGLVYNLKGNKVFDLSK